MRPWSRHLSLVLVAFGLGAAASLAFGPAPDEALPAAASDIGWDKGEDAGPALALADTRWEARTPWGAPPKPPVPATPPPPPPPMPVGVTRSGRGAEAIFLVHGTGELRVAPGGPLPDGGRLLRISGLRVEWRDGEGREHKRELFVDPPPQLSTSQGVR